MNRFLPEGALLDTPHNQLTIRSATNLAEAAMEGRVVEARAVLCDADHNLHVEMPCMEGIIPYYEGAVGIAEGTTRDIALISRVSKPVCFTVSGFEHLPDGRAAGGAVPAGTPRNGAGTNTYKTCGAETLCPRGSPGWRLSGLSATSGAGCRRCCPSRGFRSAGSHIPPIGLCRGWTFSAWCPPWKQPDLPVPAGAAGHVGGKRGAVLPGGDGGRSRPLGGKLRHICGADPQSGRGWRSPGKESGWGSTRACTSRASCPTR